MRAPSLPRASEPPSPPLSVSPWDFCFAPPFYGRASGGGGTPGWPWLPWPSFPSCSPLAAVSFLGRYLPYPQTDWNALCRALRLTALLVFLGERGGGRLRWVLWCAAALHGLTALLGRSAAASPLTTVSEYVGLLGLVAASVLAMVWMKRENRFYRLFAPLFLAALGLGVAVWGVHALAEPQWGQELLLQLRTGFQMGLPRFLLWKLSLPALGAGVLAALIHLLQTEAERRTEARLLPPAGELAQENYENLR